MEKIRLLLLLQFIFISTASSQTQNVLKFGPKLGTEEAEVTFAKFAIDSGLRILSGFSVCIRANFELLNNKCLFKADENLEMILFEYHLGFELIKNADVVTKRPIIVPGMYFLASNKLPWTVFSKLHFLCYLSTSPIS